ncbi:MAG: protein-L-isoaspartate O-methyltransferase, partial [Pseudomonadota bacterium]
GYQAAVLAPLVEQVFTVERIDELSRQARRRFRELNLRNVRAKCEDGRIGWPANAPYDAILVTAATATVPEELFEQLDEDGGVLVAPVGPQSQQQLLRFTRRGDKLERADLGGVVFVPLLHGIS